MREFRQKDRTAQYSEWNPGLDLRKLGIRKMVKKIENSDKKT